MSTQNYDPTLVKVIFGVLELEGFAEDSMIEFEWDEDRFSQKKGVDGGFSRSKKAASSGVLTVHLMQTSRSNLELTSIHKQDILADGGAGVATLLIKDGNGVSLLSTAEAYIMGFPASAYAAEVGERAWKIQVNDPEVVEGGV